MALSHLLSIFLLWSLLLSTPTKAFDITKVLEQYPEYDQFNELLTKTGVAEQINKHKSITVLAVPNGAMSGVANQDDEALEILMRIHVILDYYDSEKIKTLEDDTQLRTLYPATGSAGLLKVRKENNEIKLISAIGSSGSARVTKVVTSIPSDLSILEVSNALNSQGPDGNSPVSPSPSASSDSSPPPSPPKQDKSPPPSPSAADDDSKDSGDSKDGANADANGDGEEDDKAPVEVASSSPRNAIVSGFVLMASLFAML